MFRFEKEFVVNRKCEDAKKLSDLKIDNFLRDEYLSEEVSEIIYHLLFNGEFERDKIKKYLILFLKI